MVLLSSCDTDNSYLKGKMTNQFFLLVVRQLLICGLISFEFGGGGGL